MLSFENVQHGWLWLLLIAAGAWLLAVAYRGIFERSERKMAWVLLALRGAGLLALVLALAKPTWTRDTERVDPGRLAVVLDDSLSMSLADSSGKPRYARAVDAVAVLTEAVRADRSAPRLEVDVFDLNGDHITDEIPAEPRGERTDLVRAVTQTTAQLRSKLLVGLVLVSDGVDNTGRGDATELAERAVPIYTVGFSADPEAARLDLAVKGVQAPERVMVNNEIKVNVLVSKESGPATDATVALKRGPEEFASTRVSLPEGNAEQQVGLTFTPKEAGNFVFTAAVSTEAGERLQANNARHFPLQVDADAIRVLYLEGFLRYEYKFLKERLEDDPDVSLISVVRRVNPERLTTEAGEAVLTPERLENLDLAILGDMEGDYLSAAEWQALVRWVDAGHAVLVLGGYRSFGPSGFRTTPLADALPVVFADGPARQTEDPFILELTERGRQHPIFEITGDRVKDGTLWSTAPHLAGSSLVERAKPGAEVLAVNPNEQLDGRPAVVIATQRYGSGHTMVIAADTTWRWTRLTRVLGQNDTLYSRFWSQTVRWLTGRDLDQRRSQLVVSTNRPDYDVGKEVAVRVVRQTEAGGEIAAGDVAVEIVDPVGKRSPLPVRSGSAEPNVFVGGFYASAGGRYEVDAFLTSEGKRVANQKTEFLVHGSDLELADAGVNRALLESIANKSGGVYVDVDHVEQLAGKLQRKERRVSRVERTEYWNSPFLFLFFLAAVTGEWVLRRRNHLV